MRYYNRFLGPELMALVAPGGPLAWMLPLVIQDKNARLDFRREDHTRNHGGLQIYYGRTSPLEVLGRQRARTKFTANDKYMEMTPDLFGSHRTEDLPRLEPLIRQHLSECRERASSSFTQGEAVQHNGMMRRYGLHFRPDDPIQAVDSEAVIGFRASGPYPNGTAHKRAHKRRILNEVGLPARDIKHNKLDVLGVLRSGDVALVEVKEELGDIRVAACQLAVHMFSFQVIQEREGYNLSRVFDGMLEQKRSLGLVPEHFRRAVDRPSLVPIIAAPDPRANWREQWTAAVSGVVARTPFLKGLRFWRLTEQGEVAEEHTPPLPT
jgi:hypothetical protein